MSGGASSIHDMSTQEWRTRFEADGCVDLWVQEEFNAGSRLVVRRLPPDKPCMHTSLLAMLLSKLHRKLLALKPCTALIGCSSSPLGGP